MADKSGKSPGANVITIKNKQDFDNAISQAGDKLVVIYFSATWCGPCRSITPTFNCLTKDAELLPHVVFCKVDVDEAADLAEECEIACMPTFQFYRGESKLSEFCGGNKDKLKECVMMLK